MRDLVSAEFLGPDGPIRARKARAMADEAKALADTASIAKMRATYLELQRQWILLADEIERVEKSAGEAS